MRNVYIMKIIYSFFKIYLQISSTWNLKGFVFSLHMSEKH